MMPLRAPTALVCSALAALVVLPMASAQSVQNPGFETDDFATTPGYTSNNGGTITGWTLSETSNIGLNPATDSPFADNGATPEGNNVAFIQTSGQLSNTIIGLTVGKAYLIEFRANTRAATGRTTPSWSINEGPSWAFTAYPPVGGTNPYYTISRSFVATATTASLSIRNDSLTDSSLLIDAVTVTEVPLLTVANTNDSGPGSLREAIRSAPADKHVTFAPSLSGSTITLNAGELLSGNWQTFAWTNDADSGLSSALTYTHAYNWVEYPSFFDSPVINGVPFTGISYPGFNDFNFFISGLDSITYDDTNNILDNPTGNSQALAADHAVANGGFSLRLDGLITGKTYQTSFYCIGNGATGTRLLNGNVDGTITELNEQAFGYKNGTRLVHEFVAVSPSQTISISKTTASNVIFYAFTNAEVTPSSSASLTLDASSLPDGLSLSGNDAHRIFRIGTGTSLNLDKVSLVHANAIVTDANGGAIFNAGRIAAYQSSFANNNAQRYGGAIYNNTAAILDLNECRIEDNTSSFSDGLLNYGSCILSRSTIDNNHNSAIFSTGSLQVLSSTFSNNTSNSYGGALYSIGSAEIRNSTFSQNQASLGGGAIYQSSSTQTLTITHSTISGNTGTGNCGGLFADSNVTVVNSIIAGNTGPFPDVLGSFDPASSGNLIGSGSGLTGFSNGSQGNLVGGSGSAVIDPLLLPLASSGGPTASMVPHPDSPAIDAATTTSLTLDQRGRSRAIDGDGNGTALPDIGAVEFKRAVVTSKADSGTGTLRNTIQDPIAADIITFNTTPLNGFVFDGSPASQINLTSALTVSNSTFTIDASDIPHGVTLSGNGTHRLLSIEPDSGVILNNFTLKNGVGIGTEEDGGAVYNQGNFTAIATRFLNNTAEHYAGAIYSGYDATLNLTDCTISGNTAPFAGGIAAFGPAVIKGSTISRNSNIGIYSFTSLSLVNSTLAENIAGEGAGTEAGGAIYNGGSGILSLDHCTVSANAALSWSGGISSYASVTLKNSIIAGNRSAISSDFHGPVSASSFGNVIGDGNGLTGISNGSQNNHIGTASAPLDPYLAPLGSYGGPTPTMALLVGSPAIDAVTTATQTTDQRGITRFGLDDIGAHESGLAFSVTMDGDNDGLAPGSLRSAINGAASTPGSRVIFSIDPSASILSLTNGEIVIPPNSSIFIDASRLVESSENPLIIPNPDRPGTTLSPRGVTIDANSASRIFSIPATSTLAILGLTVQNGKIDIPGGNGAAIHNEGTLVANESTFRNNDVGFGKGGAIFGSTNSATEINNSTLHANKGQQGGALFSSGLLTVNQSTFSGNQGSYGGAIHSEKIGEAHIRSSTLSSNTAAFGGAIYNLTSNLNIENSIVSGNNGALGKDIINEDAKLTQKGHNLIQGVLNFGTSTVSGTTALTILPKLSPLADNGGSTLTMAPLDGSPALDATPASLIIPFNDQRGFPRILNESLDIGAYEAPATTHSSTTLTLHASVPAALIDAGTMRFEISEDPNSHPVVNTVSGDTTFGSNNGPIATATYGYPAEISKDSLGNLYLADSGNNRIRRITPNGEVETIAGSGSFGRINGDGPSATFSNPSGIVVGLNDELYVADTLNHCIRKISPPDLENPTWQVTTFAGFGTAGFQDGTGTYSLFSHPHGIAIDSNGNLLVADTSNHRIRKITPEAVVTTYAGNGSVGSKNSTRLTSSFSSPHGVAIDSEDTLFIADTGNHLIRKVGADQMVTTFAGSLAGFADGTGPAAKFRGPAGIAFDAANNLYVADQLNHAVRKLSRPASPLDPPIVSTLGGTGTAGFADGQTTANGAKFNRPTGICITNSGRILVVDQSNNSIRSFDFPQLVDATPGAITPLGQSINALIDATALGLNSDTRYYFRWVASDGSTQATGQTFTFSSPFVLTPFGSWQLTYFGSDSTDPAIAGPDANPSKDGINNLLKYGLGIDPRFPSGSTPLQIGRDSSGRLTLAYPQVTSSTDIRYTVEWSTDLEEWKTTGITGQTLTTTGGLRNMLATAPASTAPQQFIRLSITFP